MGVSGQEWDALMAVPLPFFHIVLIWLLALLSLSMIRRVPHALKKYILDRVDALRDSRRLDTLMNLFRYTANIVIVGIAIVLTLGVIGCLTSCLYRKRCKLYARSLCF